MRRHGELVPREQIEELVGELDEHGFLDSAALRASAGRAIDAAFLAAPAPPGQPTRAAPIAGDPGRAARAPWTASSRSPAGPGRDRGAGVRAARVARAHRAPHRLPPRRPRLRVGVSRPGRARRRRPLRDLRHLPRGDGGSVRPHPQGLRHAARRRPRSIGTSSRRSAARARQDCFGSELAHRGEHSIEFQAVFLRYLFGGRRDITHRARARELRPRGPGARPGSGGRSARGALPRRARGDDGGLRAPGGVHRRRRPRPRGPALRRPAAGRAGRAAQRSSARTARCSRAVAAGDADGVLRVGRGATATAAASAACRRSTRCCGALPGRTGRCPPATASGPIPRASSRFASVVF